jgi:phytoene dehydrogenase-like protein
MAPEGKGVIKVELVSGYSYWKQLYADKPKYEAAKQRVAEQVIEVLESHFPGIKDQVEAVDVPTLMTWERFMNGTHGFSNGPNKKFSFTSLVMGGGKETGLPGLSNFYFAGIWSTMTGALFSNANSGRTVIRTICKKDGKNFQVKA